MLNLPVGPVRLTGTIDDREVTHATIDVRADTFSYVRLEPDYHP